jgi:hypothetical protein
MSVAHGPESLAPARRSETKSGGAYRLLMVYLGHCAFRDDWCLVRSEAVSAYSLAGRSFESPADPAPGSCDRPLLSRPKRVVESPFRSGPVINRGALGRSHRLITSVVSALNRSCVARDQPIASDGRSESDPTATVRDHRREKWPHGIDLDVFVSQKVSATNLQPVWPIQSIRSGLQRNGPCTRCGTRGNLVRCTCHFETKPEGSWSARPKAASPNCSGRRIANAQIV